MLTIQPDPTWLVDSFQYAEKTGTDRYSKPTFAPSVDISKVRIDYHKTYERDGTQLTQVGEAVIYVYSQFSEGIPTNGFVEDSDVLIDGKQYKVNMVKEYHEVTSPVPFSFELVIQ